MSNAKVRGWGDPSAKGYREQHIVGVDTPAGRVYLRREVAHLFMGFLQEITARGFKLNTRADDWGYAYRPIRGYETKWARTHDFAYLSNHSWGLALDLDATDHPMGTRKGFPGWVVDTAHKWGLSWGGDYLTRPDPMHFEFLGTPADVARYPLGGTTPPAPVPLPPVFITLGSMEDAMRITVPVRVDSHRGYADLTKGYAGLPRTIGADQVLALTYAGDNPSDGWGPHAQAPLELVDIAGVARVVIPQHDVDKGVIGVYVTVSD